MGLKGIADIKLEKLKITAYSDADRHQQVPDGELEAMFNPESIDQTYSIRYGRGQGVSSSDQESLYTRTSPSELKLELILDGTGVTDPVPGIPRIPPPKSVSERVEQFLDMAYRKNGERHEPNYLRVSWGDLWQKKGFDCRLGSVKVTYNRFEPSGNPLRAKLEITLVSDATVEKQLREDNQTSPDLTHRRLVVAGDTLPLLSQRIYGSPDHYLMLARYNGLDDFRNLKPGTELEFPPLAIGGASRAGTA